MTARNLEAALALHRFGFGPVAGSIAAIATIRAARCWPISNGRAPAQANFIPPR